MADLLFILFGFSCFAYICRMNNSFTCLVTYIQTNQTGGQPWSCLVVGDEGWICPSRKLLCLCYTQKIYATHAWHTSILVWLLGRSSCSSPSTKELHVSGIQWYIVPLCERYDIGCWSHCLHYNLQHQRLASDESSKVSSASALASTPTNIWRHQTLANCKYWKERVPDKYLMSKFKSGTEQCDHKFGEIWPLWQHLKVFFICIRVYIVLGKILKLLWQFVCNWAKYQCHKWQKNWTNYLAIWSHWNERMNGASSKKRKTFPTETSFSATFSTLMPLLPKSVTR